MAQFNTLHMLTPELFFNVPMSEQLFQIIHVYFVVHILFFMLAYGYLYSA